MAFVFCENQVSTICMYINVIYFFVMPETFVHTIFEPLAKKHLPFFSCSTKKKIPLNDAMRYDPAGIFEGAIFLLLHSFLLTQNDV
jgi:hypothetical protein